MVEPVQDYLLNFMLNELLLVGSASQFFSRLNDNIKGSLPLFQGAPIKISERKPQFQMQDKIFSLFAEDDVTGNLNNLHPKNLEAPEWIPDSHSQQLWIHSSVIESKIRENMWPMELANDKLNFFQEELVDVTGALAPLFKRQYEKLSL